MPHKIHPCLWGRVELDKEDDAHGFVRHVQPVVGYTGYIPRPVRVSRAVAGDSFGNGLLIRFDFRERPEGGYEANNVEIIPDDVNPENGLRTNGPTNPDTTPYRHWLPPWA